MILHEDILSIVQASDSNEKKFKLVKNKTARKGAQLRKMTKERKSKAPKSNKPRNNRLMAANKKIKNKNLPARCVICGKFVRCLNCQKNKNNKK